MTRESPGDGPTDLFLSLTPHKVIEAVEAAGVLCNRVCYPLSSFENRVYEVEREDRSRVVAKFYRPGRWSEAQILEEHRFLADLVEAEIPVCATHPFPDGGTLRRIDHIAYCLFERAGGRAPDELNDELAARLGRLVARIHNVGAAREATHRLRLTTEAYVREDLRWLEAKKAIPARIERRYLTAASTIADLADAGLAGLDVHRIHGDLHAANLLLRDGVLRALDFDDMMVGPAVQDVWLLFPGRDAETRRLRDLFLDGYEELRAFDHGSLRMVEPLRGLRLIHYAAWLARRWHDPIFPRTFVHFGTEAYWDEQTRDLEELIEVIRAGDGGGPVRADEKGEEEEKFFWDLN
ncbi:MAG: serine/threonine protein kinase [Minicystis sp.]